MLNEGKNGKARVSSDRENEVQHAGGRGTKGKKRAKTKADEKMRDLHADKDVLGQKGVKGEYEK